MFSIIMPAFNEGEKIRKSIESVLSQDFGYMELIIVNDGSIDNTLDIINEYTSDMRLKVITQENSGPSIARNLGLSEALNDYIIFIDADDYVSDGLLTKLAKYIANNKFDIIHFSKIIRSKKEVLYFEQIVDKVEVEQIVDELIVNEQINSVWSKVYRRDKIVNFGLKFNSNIWIGEDLLFNLDYLKYCSTIDFVNIGYYIYNTSVEGSLTNNITLKKYKELVKLHNTLDSKPYKDNKEIFYQEKSITFIIYKNKLSYLRSLSIEKNVENLDLFNEIHNELKSIKLVSNIIKWKTICLVVKYTTSPILKSILKFLTFSEVKINEQ